jgi:hypothetical protein
LQCWNFAWQAHQPCGRISWQVRIKGKSDLVTSPEWLSVNLLVMDEGTIKTQNPKCRLYWCLIKFIYWRYSQSCWYFQPFLLTVAPIPTLWPPPPSQSKCTVYTDTNSVCLWGRGVGGGVELCCRPYSAGV